MSTQCESCGASSYHAAPGVPCVRCSNAGIGSPRSGVGEGDIRPRYNVPKQEEIVSVLPAAEGRADGLLLEKVLAVFNLNVAEIQ